MFFQHGLQIKFCEFLKFIPVRAPCFFNMGFRINSVSFWKFIPVWAPCYGTSPPCATISYTWSNVYSWRGLRLPSKSNISADRCSSTLFWSAPPNPHQSRRYRVLYDRSDSFAGQLGFADSPKACDHHEEEGIELTDLSGTYQGFACSILDVLSLDMLLHIPNAYCSRQ